MNSLYQALRRLSGRSGLLVPAVYPYLLDDGFVMVEWIEAPTISQLLQSRKSRLAHVISALEGAGKWLGAYHGDDEANLECLAVDRMVDDVRIGMASGASWPRTPRGFENIFSLLNATKQTARRIPIRVSLAHGDFQPDNLLVDGDRVIGIDVSGVYSGPVVDDIAHFLLHLDLQLLHPKGWRFLPWRCKLRSAFLESYYVHGSPVEASVLAWAELQRALCQYYDRMDKSKGWVRTAFLKICYGRCARLHAENLRRTL